MPKRTWIVHLEDGTHTVKLTHGYFSGNRTIKVDAEVVHKSTKFMDFGGSYPLTIGDHPGLVLIRPIFVTYGYDLVLDGISVETGKPTLPPLPMPAWAWLFVIACSLMPVATRGAAIPVVIGAGCAVLCVHLLRDASRSKATRIGGSLGITALCWVLFGLFFMPRTLPSPDPCPLFAPGPVPTLEAGWIVHDDKIGRFAIAVPSSWEVIRYEQDGYEAQLERIRAHNPQAAHGIDETLREAADSGTVLFAADMSVAAMDSGLPGTVAIARRPVPRETLLRDYVESNLRYLNQQAFVEKPIACELRGFGTGLLGVVRFRAKATQGNGSTLHSYNAIYMAVRGEDAYLIAFGTPATLSQEYALLFDRIGQTFTLAD